MKLQLALLILLKHHVCSCMRTYTAVTTRKDTGPSVQKTYGLVAPTDDENAPKCRLHLS